MPDKDYLRSIDTRLGRIENVLDIRATKIEDRVNILEGIEDRRRGAFKVIIFLWTIGSGVAGYIGAKLGIG